MVVKNPADFIGNVLGASESNTKAILANTVGKVLVIDEVRWSVILAFELTNALEQAYMLYGGGSTGAQNDPYKIAVIDTIVAEIQSVPGEDRCVLMLGYEDQMMEMFQVRDPHVRPDRIEFTNSQFYRTSTRGFRVDSTSNPRSVLKISTARNFLTFST